MTLMTRIQGKEALIKKGLTWIALAISLIVFINLSSIFTTPSQLMVDDFVEYWSSAKLNLTQGNPYNPVQEAQIQYQIGRVENIPLMMYNPPWTLLIAMPMALFPYPVSRALWFLLQVAIIFGCARLLWRLYKGSPARPWIAWLVAFTMAPTLQLLKMGQISGMLFLGITAFLYFHQKKKGWLAGLSVGLLFIKPHTLFLFLAVYALWCLKTRNWSYIGGTLLALTGATLIAVAVNPLVLGQYIQAMPLITLNIFFPATWGTLLRMIFGQDKFWLQYIPPVLGLVWLLWYWWKNRKTWEWIDHLPLLIFVSAITTAYGWVCDQTVIVLPMIGMSVVFFQGKWTSKKAIIVGVYILINCVAAFLRVLQVYFFWLSAAYLILYLVARPDKKEPRVNLEPIPTESLSS